MKSKLGFINFRGGVGRKQKGKEGRHSKYGVTCCVRTLYFTKSLLFKVSVIWNNLC